MTEPQRKANLLNFSRDDLRGLVQQLGFEPFRGNQLFRGIFQRRLKSIEAVHTLPLPLRRELAKAHTIRWPTLLQRESDDDGVTKLFLRLDDGKTVETVVDRSEKKNEICLSSQVGCGYGCRFCLSGKAGVFRNLEAGEIIGQLFCCLEEHQNLLGRIEVNFMGMGEPLLNLESVLQAFRTLIDRRGLGLSHRRIAVSTVGLIRGIQLLAALPLAPRLAVSLNAATQEKRLRIMPVSRLNPIEPLLETLRRYPATRWKRIVVVYVLIQGVNDSFREAKLLKRLLRDMWVEIVLVPVNESPLHSFRRPSNHSLLRFQLALEDAFPVKLRTSRGHSIAADWGMLSRAGGA